MIASRLHSALSRFSGQDPGGHTALDSLLLSHLQGIYGSGDLLCSKLESLRKQCALFIEAFGDGPIRLLRAPARINILGEHVDYVSYLPTASLTFGSREHEMTLCYRPSGNRRVRGRSTLEPFEPFSFELEEEPGESLIGAEKDWERFLFSRSAPAPHWSNYIKGAACFAQRKHGGRIRQGIHFVLDSSVPPAGGASSSSALTVIAGAALLRANHTPCPLLELALDSAKAEWYVGTRGGTMDHLTICLSREANAVHISYADGRCELIPLPGAPYRWLTFFSHPADKGKEVMLEYNERAAMSRIWIPALLHNWAVGEPSLYEKWQAAQESLCAGSATALDELERLLENLPETITLTGMAHCYADASAACERAFPALVQERGQEPLRVRDRARHHLGEVRRVAEARHELQDAARHAASDSELDSAMRRIGKLLNASHHSLQNLYEVCTPEVNQLVEIITSHPGVFGARLMGGGFGGNVLALTTEDTVSPLIACVQEHFYGPGARNGRSEGSVMISTPGSGLSALDPEEALRTHFESFNARWREADKTRGRMRSLLGQLAMDPEIDEVWPIVLAAGEGKRARAGGLQVPKPLAPVLGIPSVVRVFQAVKLACNPSRPIVVIVSPETEPALRAALMGENISWVLQARALGTGDAILCAREAMQNFQGRVLVVWGTQPVLRAETVSLSVKLAALFPEYPMVFPTAAMARPYAPVQRDADGRICAAQETHLEKARVPAFGESNVGLFLLWNEMMVRELEELRRLAWKEDEGCYDRPGGELGFPNEMIRRLAGRPAGVLASPIADRREEKGIKTLEDVALCEQYLHDLIAGKIEQD